MNVSGRTPGQQIAAARDATYFEFPHAQYDHVPPSDGVMAAVQGDIAYQRITDHMEREWGATPSGRVRTFEHRRKDLYGVVMPVDGVDGAVESLVEEPSLVAVDGKDPHVHTLGWRAADEEREILSYSPSTDRVSQRRQPYEP